MRAVVTGATGLLGRHIVAQLVAQGGSVTAIVRADSNRNSLPGSGVAFHVCDLSRSSIDPDIFRGADAVFHAAAAVSDWAPWSYFQANTIGSMQRLCESMKAAGCRKLLHVSTVGVYGRPRTSQPIAEDHPQRAMSFWDYYTRAKIRAEQIVWENHRAGNLEVSVIRPAMLYGPGDRALLARVIDLLRQGKIMLVGDPQMNLPLVHTRDVATAAVLAATAETAKGEAFNVVNPEPVPQAHFFNTIASLIGAAPVKRRVPYRVAYATGFAAEIFGHTFRSRNSPPITRYRVSLFGHPRIYSVDKLRSRLDWKPALGFAEGIREGVEWHLDHEKL